MVTALLRRPVDALLIVPAGAEHRWLQRARRRHAGRVPRPPAAATSRPTRSCSTTSAARAPAVEHLIAHGHERIAYVGDAAAAVDRRASASPATAPRCATPGSPSTRSSCAPAPTAPTRPSGGRATLLALPADRRPTALFTANNRNTVGALRALRDGDGTVALVGFDDFELADMLARPRHRRAPRAGRDGPHRRRAGVRAARRRRRAAAARDDRRASSWPADPGSCRAMKPPPSLPPNPIRRFYLGGPAIAALRGIDARRRPHARGVGRLGDHALRRERARAQPPARRHALRDAVAADPEGFLGADHVARFGADPALLVKLLDAGERLPVHDHPDDAFAREHLGLRLRQDRGVDRHRAREPGAEVRRRLPRGRRARTRSRAGSTTQDHDAMLDALNPRRR